MIVVLDSGIYVSAMEFGGVPGDALVQAITSDTLLICAEIEVEVIRVLSGKFGHNATEIEARMADYSRAALRVKIAQPIQRVCRDPKDDFILECAATGNAEFIVTGDKDLLSLHSHGDIAIITPRQYLDHVRDREASQD